VAARKFKVVAKAYAVQKLSRAATQKLLAGAVVQSWHAFSNYKLQADHAAFGDIALSLAFGPHGG
jgi:hypothetical protein